VFRPAGAHVAGAVNQHVTEPGDPVPGPNRLIADDAFHGGALRKASPPVAGRMHVLSAERPLTRQDRLRAHQHSGASVMACSGRCDPSPMLRLAYLAGGSVHQQ